MTRKPLSADGIGARCMKARSSSGTCELCSAPIIRGQVIIRIWTRWCHATCVIENRAKLRQAQDDALAAAMRKAHRAEHR